MSDISEIKEKTVFLNIDNWDDFGYKTYFNVSFYNGETVESIGGIRIAKSGMEKGFVSHYLRYMFEYLEEGFYSLWDSVKSYEKAYKISKNYDFNIFEDLNDVAYDLNKLNKYKYEPVFNDSLIRFTTIHTCANQYNRISHGKAILTPFSFSYLMRSNCEYEKDLKLDFEIKPKSFPPTNIHAIIGSNGAGKTKLLKGMIGSICNQSSDGNFLYNNNVTNEEYGYFESVILISFSPFDDYSEVEEYKGVYFIGFKKKYKANGDLLENIKDDFIESFKCCWDNISIRNDFINIINILVDNGGYSDTIADIIEQLASENNEENLSLLNKEFDIMSSGHKVALSIITRCFAKLVEKTIVFIDEPENHLHPPLLSTLIRVLSKIFNDRNAVGIISTHSPIVLQEIPKSCIWKLNRVNDFLSAFRVDYETFGANIGVLTDSVFGFEIMQTGFNSYLKDVVKEYNSFEDVLKEFDYQLGDQAKAMVMMLLSRKEDNDEKSTIPTDRN